MQSSSQLVITFCLTKKRIHKGKGYEIGWLFLKNIAKINNYGITQFVDYLPKCASWAKTGKIFPYSTFFIFFIKKR